MIDRLGIKGVKKEYIWTMLFFNVSKAEVCQVTNFLDQLNID